MTKYWMVSARNALVGTLCILPFSEKDLSAYKLLVKQTNELCPNEGWKICTNECVTTFPEQGLRFSDGQFSKL